MSRSMKMFGQDQKKDASTQTNTSLTSVPKLYLDAINSAAIREHLLYLKTLLNETPNNKNANYQQAKELLKSLNPQNVVMEGNEFMELHEKIIKLYPNYPEMVQPIKDRETLQRKPNSRNYDYYANAAFSICEKYPNYIKHINIEYLKQAAIHSAYATGLIIQSELCNLFDAHVVLDFYYAHRHNPTFHDLLTHPQIKIHELAQLPNILKNNPKNMHLIEESLNLQKFLVLQGGTLPAEAKSALNLQKK